MITGGTMHINGSAGWTTPAKSKLLRALVQRLSYIELVSHKMTFMKSAKLSKIYHKYTASGLIGKIAFQLTLRSCSRKSMLVLHTVHLDNLMSQATLSVLCFTLLNFLPWFFSFLQSPAESSSKSEVIENVQKIAMSSSEFSKVVCLVSWNW